MKNMRDKGHFIVFKGAGNSSVRQSFKNLQQKLTRLKKQRDKSIIMIEEFNNSFLHDDEQR